MKKKSKKISRKKKYFSADGVEIAPGTTVWIGGNGFVHCEKVSHIDPKLGPVSTYVGTVFPNGVIPCNEVFVSNESKSKLLTEFVSKRKS